MQQVPHDPTDHAHCLVSLCCLAYVNYIRTVVQRPKPRALARFCYVSWVAGVGKGLATLQTEPGTIKRDWTHCMVLSWQTSTLLYLYIGSE